MFMYSAKYALLNETCVIEMFMFAKIVFTCFRRNISYNYKNKLRKKYKKNRAHYNTFNHKRCLCFKTKNGCLYKNRFLYI